MVKVAWSPATSSKRRRGEGAQREEEEASPQGKEQEDGRLGRRGDAGGGEVGRRAGEAKAGPPDGAEEGIRSSSPGHDV